MNNMNNMNDRNPLNYEKNNVKDERRNKLINLYNQSRGIPTDLGKKYADAQRHNHAQMPGLKEMYENDYDRLKKKVETITKTSEPDLNRLQINTQQEIIDTIRLLDNTLNSLDNEKYRINDLIYEIENTTTSDSIYIKYEEMKDELQERIDTIDQIKQGYIRIQKDLYNRLDISNYDNLNHL